MDQEIPKRRGRPPKNRDGKRDEDAILGLGEIAKERDAAESQGRFPDAFIGGLPNPDHWRAKLARLNELNLNSLVDGTALPNYKSSMDGILAEAEFSGLDRKVLADVRTDVEKVSDLFQLIKEGSKTIFEATEDEIKAVEAVMDASDLMVRQFLTDQGKDARMEWSELGKQMGSLIRRLKVLRERAKNPVPLPKDETDFLQGPENKLKNLSQRIAKPLRLMVYALRSNISHLQKKGGAASVIQIEPYHAAMAYNLFCTINKCEVIGGEVKEGYSYAGGLIVIPPGHGKTTFACAAFGQLIAENPYEKLMVVHAVEELSIKNVEYMKTMFKTDNPTGRRFAGLYPGMRLTKKRNGTGEMNLVTKEKSATQTIRAYGMKSKVQGADASIIWFDDPVDKSERDQENERERTFTTMTGSWMSRLRGTQAWHFTTTTLWHHNDANARRLRLAREKKLWLKTLCMGCGGPKSFPPFKPLSKNLCPSSRLRQQYAQDPVMYAAVYMSNPSPDESRIIKQLRYYDPASEEHANFLSGAVFHLSLDPSATARQDSDKAGMVYAACGQVEGNVKVTQDDGVETVERKVEKRCRIVWATAIHATQHDLVRKSAEFCQDRRVDFVHVEVVSGYYGTSELFRNLFGIEPIEHKPGNKSKEIRLKGVGSLLEDSFRLSGASGACVEFPGKIEDKNGVPTLGPDPEYQWLYNQFLNFGSTNEDHCLDATTQLLAELQRRGDLAPGQGFVSEMVRSSVRHGFQKSRMASEYAQLRKDLEKKRTVHEEDAEFISGRSDSWSGWSGHVPAYL